MTKHTQIKIRMPAMAVAMILALPCMVLARDPGNERYDIHEIRRILNHPEVKKLIGEMVKRQKKIRIGSEDATAVYGPPAIVETTPAQNRPKLDQDQFRKIIEALKTGKPVWGERFQILIRPQILTDWSKKTGNIKTVEQAGKNFGEGRQTDASQAAPLVLGESETGSGCSETGCPIPVKKTKKQQQSQSATATCDPQTASCLDDETANISLGVCDQNTASCY